MIERDAKLDARYRELASEEPSVVIDDAIRAAAHRAAASRRGSFGRRWAAPVSIAAVLVLAVGVTLRMQLEQPGVEVPTIDSVAPSAPALERVPAADPAPAADRAPTAQRAPASAATAISKLEVDTRAKRAAPEAKKDAAPGAAKEAVLEAKPESAPRPKLDVQESRAQAKDQVRRDEFFAQKSAAEPAPAQKPAPAPFPAFAPPAATAAPSAAPAPAMAPAPARVIRQEDAAASVAAQPLAKAKETESVTGDKSFADKLNANVAEPGRAGFASGATPPSGKVAAGVLREAPAAGERAATPEKELERIAQLRRAGRHVEADEALARFQREHPDYRIAEEIWETVRAR